MRRNVILANFRDGYMFSYCMENRNKPKEVKKFMCATCFMKTFHHEKYTIKSYKYKNANTLEEGLSSYNFECEICYKKYPSPEGVCTIS